MANPPQGGDAKPPVLVDAIEDSGAASAESLLWISEVLLRVRN